MPFCYCDLDLKGGQDNMNVVLKLVLWWVCVTLHCFAVVAVILGAAYLGILILRRVFR